MHVYFLLLLVIENVIAPPSSGQKRSRLKRDFRVGQKRCQPRFSEISTLYLGTNSQDNQNNFDEFLEIDFPEEQCAGIRRPSLMPYFIMVFDTRPKSRELTGSLLYSSLHQRTLQPNSLYFVMGNQSEQNVLWLYQWSTAKKARRILLRTIRTYRKRR
ncbi:hypothetical protein RB195_001561 [Necator americanus]|uniref:Uncharacterized protein n=1 Tax=Necator americanus TaxID=51031 RepID=A0ABR1DFH0_NECAM